MGSLRNLVLGVLVGLAVGLWCGVNLGKGRPLWANPFANDSVQQQIKRTGSNLLEKGSDALEKGSQALKRKLGE